MNKEITLMQTIEVVAAIYKGNDCSYNKTIHQLEAVIGLNAWKAREVLNSAIEYIDELENQSSFVNNDMSDDAASYREYVYSLPQEERDFYPICL
jgi:hypothetical protein